MTIDYDDSEIEETYLASQAEQIANLNQVIINLRAQLVLQDKKLKTLDSKKEAFNSAMDRVSGVDKVLERLQKEVKYYEDNVELVWKRKKKECEWKKLVREQQKKENNIINFFHL